MPTDIEKTHGNFLKVDGQERIYFTLKGSNYIYLYNKKGEEITRFGTAEGGDDLGEFTQPDGLTVDEKYLYVCDKWLNRLQVVDKENGNSIRQWNKGQRLFKQPTSVLLHENLLYVGDMAGVQVFTREGEFVQSIGKGEFGSGEGECQVASGLLMIKDRLYIADFYSQRVQVWN